MNNYLLYILNDDPNSGIPKRHKFLRLVLGKLNYPFILRTSLILQSIDSNWKENLLELQMRLSSLGGEQAASENRINVKADHQINEINAIRAQLDLQRYEINEYKTQLDLQRHIAEKKVNKDRDYEGSILINQNSIIIGRRDDLITRYFAEIGSWDSHIFEALQQNDCKFDGIALDVGSHVGTISIPLSKMFQEVHCFEANDANYQILCANKVLNNSDNLQTYNTPLYSSEIEMSLSHQKDQEIEIPIDSFGKLHPELGSNSGGYTFSENGTGIYSKVSKTIDYYNFQNVRFIKIDAQGCDLEILLGGLKTIQRDKPLIIFEIETHLVAQHKTSFQDIEQKLISFGYSVNVLKEHNDKQRDYICVWK